MTIETYEDLLELLDLAARKHREKGEEQGELNMKLEYFRKETAIANARRTLRVLYFEVEDYCKTGTYEVGTITAPKTCAACNGTGTAN